MVQALRALILLGLSLPTYAGEGLHFGVLHERGASSASLVMNKAMTGGAPRAWAKETPCSFLFEPGLAFRGLFRNLLRTVGRHDIGEKDWERNVTDRGNWAAFRSSPFQTIAALRAGATNWPSLAPPMQEFEQPRWPDELRTAEEGIAHLVLAPLYLGLTDVVLDPAEVVATMKYSVIPHQFKTQVLLDVIQGSPVAQSAFGTLLQSYVLRSGIDQVGSLIWLVKRVPGPAREKTVLLNWIQSAYLEGKEGLRAHHLVERPIGFSMGVEREAISIDTVSHWNFEYRIYAGTGEIEIIRPRMKAGGKMTVHVSPKDRPISSAILGLAVQILSQSAIRR